MTFGHAATTLGIKELGKPPWTRCEHQCERGCDIYEERPETCQGYQCGYSLGILEGDERRRPDHLGIILDFRSDLERVRPGDPVSLQVWEVWRGALEQPNVVWLLNRIREKYPIFVQPYAG